MPIHHLKLDEELTLADVELPAGSKLLEDPETVVVQCVAPREQLVEEELPAAERPGEPELIGRKSEKEKEKQEKEEE